MAPRIIKSNVEIKASDIAFHKLLIQSCRNHSKNLFLTEYETGAQFNYEQLYNDSLSVAGALKQFGLNVGDVFMVYGFNCYEYVVALLSGLLVGGIGIPIRGIDTDYELRREIQSRDVKFLFIGSQMRDLASSVKADFEQIKRVILFDSIENDSTFDTINVMKRNENKLNESKIYDPKGNRDSIVLIMESSGTTGPAKGAMLGHYDFATTFQIYSVFFSEPDTGIGSSPLAHMSGAFQWFHAICYGRHLVSLRNTTLDNVLDAIKKHEIKRVTLSPSTMNALNKMEKHIDLSTVRVLTAGSRLPAEVAREFINKYKISQLVNCYGITEAGGSISFNTDVARNYNSVGKVIAGVQVKVVNPQTGALLGENEEGELWVKTYNAFKGYYNNSELVSSIIDSDGWIHSGDIGYYDENEELYVIDRMKDIIKQSGFGYSPVDVEEVLLQHKDVREAAVVGIPDADEGEISHAFV
ncbi:hypothetical protein B4U79_06706, partial [Dinothrombium tinctorium]